MRRRNLPAEIVEYPTANRARLKPASWPRVSIIIPTDSPTRAQSCLERLPRQTRYPDLEIVIVTNSGLIEPLQKLQPENATLLCVPYDQPFNFSDKCNVGAQAATGERFIFFNDDVESLQADWVQNLIEPLENPEVGAVAPKLLYETGKIQHAGLVTGVRGLIGTALHQRAADSTEHFNLAQSLRNVAALSAACLAVRREDFFRVGGFDAVNTPIGHSDVDLSFKIREAGLRCVYTPFATLYHAGHVSIGAEEEPAERDKSSIYLLKRWPEFTTHDPYFPDNMRDWLHTDSPTPIRMMARQEPQAVNAAPDLLFVSHDLSLSGAPIMLYHAARWCRENGIFVVVLAPKDGPLREKLTRARRAGRDRPAGRGGPSFFCSVRTRLRLRHCEQHPEQSGRARIEERSGAGALVDPRTGLGRRTLSARGCGIAPCLSARGIHSRALRTDSADLSAVHRSAGQDAL